jgi:hypothetical protein
MSLLDNFVESSSDYLDNDGSEFDDMPELIDSPILQRSIEENSHYNPNNNDFNIDILSYPGFTTNNNVYNEDNFDNSDRIFNQIGNYFTGYRDIGDMYYYNTHTEEQHFITDLAKNNGIKLCSVLVLIRLFNNFFKISEFYKIVLTSIHVIQDYNYFIEMMIINRIPYYRWTTIYNFIKFSFVVDIQ